MLIDLGGYGESGRMAACAHRIAPVQMKWVGMQTHSTGLPEMDWFLSDHSETPPELEPHYSERVLRLPDGYVCYSPPAYAPDLVPPPAAANGHISFGCFNNLAKVTGQVIRTWVAILDRGSDQRAGAEDLPIFRAGYAPPGSAKHSPRWVLAPIGSCCAELRRTEHFWRSTNQIDIVLDPFPYSGGLTTCEALWMGVPTVTLPNETFASRHSMSHLSNVGLSDWVARDIDDYVELAVARRTIRRHW